MTATETTTRSTVDTEISVADLQDVGGSTATGTVGATVPAPAVGRDETAATSAEGVILAITLGQGRWVVDIGFAYLGLSSYCKAESRQDCM